MGSRGRTEKYVSALEPRGQAIAGLSCKAAGGAGRRALSRPVVAARYLQGDPGNIFLACERAVCSHRARSLLTGLERPIALLATPGKAQPSACLLDRVSLCNRTEPLSFKTMQTRGGSVVRAGPDARDRTAAARGAPMQ